MGGNAGAIRAGKSYVEAMLNDEKLRKGLVAAEARLKAFGESVSSIGKAMALAGAAIATPIIAATKAWATAGSELADMSERTGVAASELSALKYAAGQTGTDIESLEGGLRKMQKSLSEAAQGGKEQNEALARLGLTYAQLKGKSPDQQFKTLADKIAGVPDPTLRAGAAMDIFGKSATALLPMMAGGQAAIDQLEARAKSLGLVMSDEAAKAADDLDDALADLGASIKSTYGALASAVAPVVKQVTGDLVSLLQETRAFIKENQGLVVSALKVSVGLAGLGTAMLSVSTACKTLAPVLKAVWPLLSGPVGWGAAAIAAIFALSVAIKRLRGDYEEITNQVRELKKAAAMPTEAGPVAQAKAQMDRMNALRMAAIDRASANPHDPAAQKSLEGATEAYLLARKAYNRALAENPADAKKGGEADDEGTVNRRAELEKKALDDLNAARLEAIDNAALRENEKIQSTYAKKIEEAKKAGASIAALEKARDTELATLNRRTANERSKEAARQSKAQQDDEERKGEEIYAKQAAFQDELDRAKVEATLTGKAKDLALLELEQKKAVSEAMQAGIPEEKVNELYRLKASAIGKGVKRNEEVVGTFNPYAANQMGPTTGAQRLEQQGQRQVDLLTSVEQILRRMEDAGGGIVVQ